MTVKILELGTESLSYQKDSRLKKGLTQVFAKILKDGKVSQRSLDAEKIGALIKDTTGVNASLVLAKDYEAHVMPPYIDKNNPLLRQAVRHFTTDDDAGLLKSSLGSKKRITGAIDYKSGKVSGFYSELPVPITIGKKIIFDIGLNASELAAIVAHEVGHGWTYLMTFGTLASTNQAIQAVMNDADSIDFKTESHITLTDDGYISVQRGEASGSKDAFIARTIDGIISRERSALGTSVLDRRGSEVLADQFATRHDLGVDLVTGLDKLTRVYGTDESYMSNPTFYLLQAVNAMGMLALLGVTALTLNPYMLFMTAMLLTNNPHDLVYDNTPNRTRKIREQIVHELKDKSLSKERRKMLLSHIKLIDKTASNYKDRKDVFDLFHQFLIPGGRKAAKQAEEQVRLEKMLNNELFTISATLRT